MARRRSARCEVQFLHAENAAVDPDRLWIWEKAVYMDENRRTWLPIIIKTENNFQVLMRQENISVGEALSPTQLTSCPLPLMWQLYPGGRYRGSDSSIWRIVYHIEFRGMEDMLLEQLAPLE